jgi:hypothetical protein
MSLGLNFTASPPNPFAESPVNTVTPLLLQAGQVPVSTSRLEPTASMACRKRWAGCVGCREGEPARAPAFASRRSRSMAAPTTCGRARQRFKSDQGHCCRQNRSNTAGNNRVASSCGLRPKRAETQLEIFNPGRRRALVSNILKRSCSHSSIRDEIQYVAWPGP